MSRYVSQEYAACKEWVSKKINEGFSWNDVKFLCVSQESAKNEFVNLQEEEQIIPFNMEFDEWPAFVDEYHNTFMQIGDLYGISSGPAGNTFPVPTDPSSPWTKYKKYLIGQYDGKRRMSDAAVSEIEKNSYWILNHLSRDTRGTGPIKGLVMGSVQSGKTANMIGLVTMAAYYDWNFIIVLSGTIDNLRLQTRDRFKKELSISGCALLHILYKKVKPDYMKDIENGNLYMTENLSLNLFQAGRQHNQWLHRYVTVCLKNSTRLRNLIKWLHADAAKAARLRILVIDDEADQAGVNTRKMDRSETDEELIERTAVNQLIIDLVNGKDEEGAPTKSPFQAMNYISFTATPYANVLNEAFGSSLYPKDFICSLPESKEYFGAKVIFGSANDERYPGLDIVRNVPEKELRDLKLLYDGSAFTLPDEFKKSICWFLCAAAVLRLRGRKSPISMLIHTTALQNGHFGEYEVLKAWLERERSTGRILSLCESIYEEEKGRLTPEILRECYPDYAALDEVDGSFPEFGSIQSEISLLLSDIRNIMMGDDKKLSYGEDAIHLCVDNCKANRVAEDGIYMRIVYPEEPMNKAPVFIVMGGSTLARGLTLEGLVCTYFGRNTNQADTLMQMARWFGYRKGYELLQRIWMPEAIKDKFILLEEIDEKLKSEFEDFMRKGKSPAQFGPRIMTSSKIARFLLTSKNKSQNAVECEFDFSGDSYETTKFEDSEVLADNIAVAEKFIKKIGPASVSKVNGSAYVWYAVDANSVISDFLEKYKIFDCSALSKDFPIFLNWLGQMNADGKYLKWNVAVVGDQAAPSKWNVGEISVGKIERSKKTDPSYIDIGSLRSGLDALCDVIPENLTPEQQALFRETIRTRKQIIFVRGDLGLEDTPLLLLYCIDKERGKETPAGKKTKLNSKYDIIGFSIIISGEPSGKGHVKAVSVRLPK